MGDLISTIIHWVIKKLPTRWPFLLFPMLFLAFYFVRNFFELSFRETFLHWCFLAISGVLLVVAGVLYLTITPPKPARRIIVLAMAVICVPIFVRVFLQFLPQPLPNDKLVVAIARFTPVSLEAMDEAQKFTHRIEKQLREKQMEGAPLKIQRLTSHVDGPDLEVRRRNARALGRSPKVNAHVVIWGEIRVDQGELYVQAQLTIANKLQKASIQREKLLEIDSKEPTHLEFKKRHSTEIAEMVVLVYGLAYFKVRDWEKSISILSHVGSKEADLMLGIAYLAKGDYEKSLVPLQRATGESLINAQVYNNLAMAYIHLGQIDDAKYYLEKSLGIEPGNSDILSNFALIQLIQGDYKGAMSNFSLALAGADHPKTRSNLAFCLFELHRTNEAITEWEKSLAMLVEWNQRAAIPWDGLDAKAGLAVGYFDNGNIDEAGMHYRQVIHRNVDYSDFGLLETKFFWPNRAKSRAGELIKKIYGGSK